MHRPTSGLPSPFAHLVAIDVPRCVGGEDSLLRRHGGCLPSAPGALAPVRVMLSGPSSLNRPHPPHSPAHRDFTAKRLICHAFAVRERRGDPRWFRAFTIIPSWHAVLFDPGELGHRSVQYRDADTGLRRELSGSALPNTPQSVSRGSWFSWLYGSHLLQPAKLLAPRYGSDRIAPRSTGAFTSKLSTGRSPFPLLDMTTTAALELLLSAGLAPAGMIASFAAPTPASSAPPWLKSSLGRHRPIAVGIAHCCAPPAQIRASAIHALGSHLGCLTSKRCVGHG